MHYVWGVISTNHRMLTTMRSRIACIPNDCERVTIILQETANNTRNDTDNSLHCSGNGTTPDVALNELAFATAPLKLTLTLKNG